jgi:putative transposase
MSTTYKFLNQKGIFFVSFATVGWVDVFTRIVYKEIFVESLRYCINDKGPILHACCLMTYHVQFIFSSKESGMHSAILRGIKKYTSSKLLIEIDSNTKESRKEWMLKIL